MEQLPDLLNSVGTILWPLIILFIIIRFSPTIESIIESAKSREFTLKIGGQELTMEEVNEQQRNLIADLQAQVVEIQKVISPRGITEVGILEDEYKEADEKMEETSPASILWVDDNPKNNSYFVQQLSDSGIRVDIALSTEDGIKRLERNKYRMIISDMGRQEGSVYNQSAGLDLLEEIRKVDSEIPFVIYCSKRRASETKSRANELGANAVLSSPTALMGVIKSAFPEWKT